MAKACLIIVTSLAIDMILGMAHINEKIENIGSGKAHCGSLAQALPWQKKAPATLPTWQKLWNWSMFSLEVGLTSAPCTSVWQKVLPGMTEVYLYMRSTAQGVRFVTLYENLVKITKVLWPKSIMGILPEQHFIIKAACRWSQQLLALKEMKVAICRKPPHLG